MSGVGGIGPNDSVPSIFPGPEPGEEEPEEGISLFFDPDPAYLDLGTVAQAGIELPEGQFSLLEWSQIISQVIQKLREALNDSEVLDAEVRREFLQSVIAEVEGLLAEYNAIVDQVDAWNTLLGANDLRFRYDLLVQSTNAFNALLLQTAQNDLFYASAANEAIQTFNDPDLLQDFIDTQFGGDEIAARDFLIQQIENYNNYLPTRPDLSAELQVLVEETDSYNEYLDSINEALVTVNAERAELGLPPIQPPQLDKTPPVSDDITDYLSYEGDLEEVILVIDAPSTAPINPEAVFTDPLTPERVEVFRDALKQQASPSEDAWVDQAISTAQSGGPYSSEGAFFIAVRDAYSELFDDPEDGITQFNFAIQDIPVPLIAIPLPSDFDIRLVSYKRGVSTASTEALRTALKNQVNGNPEKQKVDDAIEEAQEEGPYATTGEFYAAVKVKYAAKFTPQSQGITLFNQAILEIPLLPEVYVPDLEEDVTFVPTPVDPGEPPQASYTEAIATLWLAGAELTMLAIFSLTGSFELALSPYEEAREFYSILGLSITLPAAYVQRFNRAFLESISGIGSGVGLAGFSIGLHSRILEIALSSASIRAISTVYQMPIAGREFAVLQFTAMELLARSSLLTSLPAARFLISRLGALSSASPGIAVAIAEALIVQVGGIVSSGILSSQVNEFFNRLFARQGFLSVGGLAGFTNAVSATLSLSILSVALANLGRRIGLPGILAQFFAHGSGIPTIDLLTALTAGSLILDVLDNPISVLFLKQTLTDTLVFRRGFSSLSVGLMINNAVNNVILRGGIHSFSHLQYELVNEFQRAGFSFFEANLLANETVGLIRGDLGVQTLDVAFGLNFDSSFIAASIVSNIYGIDAGVAAAMLSNAVTRSLLYGGFGSRVRLQNELMATFQGFGLTRSDAISLAAQTLSFIESVGVLVPLSRYPLVANLLLGDPVLRAIAFGQGLVRQELIENLEGIGLSNTQAEIFADNLIALSERTFAVPGNLFDRALEEAIVRSVSGQFYQTQRDFRDQLVAELRAVGFGLNESSFLANSVANFGLTGTNISIFGVSAARISAINRSLATRLTEDLAISRREAQQIADEAVRRAILRAPFSSEDQFKAVLREEIQREVINRLGRFDGYSIVDRAVAALAPPTAILSLGALVQQLSAQIIGVLRPDLGARLAEEIKDRILVSIFGGTTIDVIENEERRDPLSVLNQINTMVSRLIDVEEEENQKKLLRKLIQLLESLMKPNAQIGYLLQSLMDNPSTFIGSLLVDKPKGEFLDIPI